ncbi:integral membrane sensor signal transduction histidine kinase [Methylorubrum populi BJ001]|jgi:signal transduction histidine kinase|uniref:histidine kinase n=1 Tax=Methylorubrum populi (strain ATCC BAA-705 / NCIMB 13946 / BJ001) TaxID=441620 RepID=B1ZBJ7_METPB|nr:ATP-binding protein [Methylorubrum populi]ACB82150.1 integral membrane sensor signal transduction histidine kinase [Methylorubrum populi BJ001]OAH23235.1 ATPase [Methylorubrum populi]PZP68697.1 MAG: HAMP domain-containing protein [Methylorubrum populi]
MSPVRTASGPAEAAVPTAATTAPPRPRHRAWPRLPWPRPKKAAGQIALLVVAALLAAHVFAGMTMLALREPWRPDERPGVAATRLSTVARLLDAAAPAERDGLLRAAAQGLPTLRIAPWDGTAPSAGQGTAEEEIGRHPLIERLRDGFGRALPVTDLSPNHDRGSTGLLQIGITTPAGARLRAVLPDDFPRPPAQGPIIFTFVFLGVSLTLLSFWATRALTAPLAGLAAAAEAFGTAEEPPPLPKRGPEEVLALARALDRMRTRLLRLLDDRTQMLAAISHDLRTPITRLRLRAEFIEDERAREMTLRDLDQMNGLVESALSYVRDGQGTPGEGETTLIDLASVVQTVCDGFSDIGAAVSLERTRHVLVRGRPDDLQRAITNLVDNAVKYGGGARLVMGPAGSGDRPGVAVEVLDDGPGIPDAERSAMLQPFVRGDRARNLDAASGFGLGLSIVLAIVEGHGGRLRLENRPGGGFCARIELPLAAGRSGETGAGKAA